MPDDATPEEWFELARTLYRHHARAATGRFLIEGTRFVLRALDADASIVAVLVASKRLTDNAAELFATLRRRGIPIVATPWDEFHRCTTSHRPSGIAAVVRQRWTPLSEARPRRAPWVAVERVRSAGNLGSLLRSMDAVGAAGLLTLGPHVDPYHPTTVRATMGSHFSVPIVRTNLGALRRWADDHDAFLIGGCGSGSCDYDDVGYPPGAVLLLGDERKGLSAAVRGACDLLVRIPMVGRLDSLNLAVAGSVLLYETFRQRRKTSRNR